VIEDFPNIGWLLAKGRKHRYIETIQRLVV
jgi:hypothetical protein